jgi:fatty acid/phospholipid biosynthesis enzyme
LHSLKLVTYGSRTIYDGFDGHIALGWWEVLATVLVVCDGFDGHIALGWWEVLATVLVVCDGFDGHVALARNIRQPEG